MQISILDCITLWKAYENNFIENFKNIARKRSKLIGPFSKRQFLESEQCWEVWHTARLQLYIIISNIFPMFYHTSKSSQNQFKRKIVTI